MTDEMMTRLDDFVRSEEAFASTELPKGKCQKCSGGLQDRSTEGKIGSTREDMGLTDEEMKKIKSVERDESWMKAPIVFPYLSMKNVSDEPLIIEAVMKGYLVRRVYVDQGASMEVMFEHCFENLSPAIRSRVRDTQMDLVGFAEGVDGPMIPLSGFLDNTLHEVREKQLVEHEVNQNINQEKGVSERVDLMEQTLVNPAYPDQLVTIKGNLSERCKNQLRILIKKSMDVFAWEPADMTGIPRRVVSKEVEEWVSAGIVLSTKMPFGLKNAKATYQRVVDTTFQSRIGRNLEAYVDDMVIKSNDEKVLIEDIVETFDNLRRINMKLNPKKCSFEMEEGNFLGFLSWSAEKSLPFFETLTNITKENKDEYRWTESAEKAFQELKKVIVELSLLTTLVKEETLYVYVAVATEVDVERGREKLCPVGKISLVVVPYVHEAMQASGKLAKYSVKRGAYNIAYEPRSAMKRQVLADFWSEAPVGTPTEEFF
nr:hypothetical protein [Tanacetum cinerariifolium]